MVSLKSIYFLIFIRVISNVHSQSSPGDVLGPSSCETYAIQQSSCGLPDVPIESFPTECSSYIYTSLSVINDTITDFGIEKQTISGYLDKLIATNKTVLIYYDHLSVQSWCEAIQPGNTDGQAAEMKSLKEFLDQHKGIKGIILKSVIDQKNPPTACPNFNQNFKCYLDLMKKTFSDMSIGIRFAAVDEIDYYQNAEFPWLDFKELDHLVDFYIINFLYLNVCSGEFLKSGPYPLTGDGNNTVDEVRILLENVGANSSKIYYRFPVYAQKINISSDFCQTFATNYCTNSADAKTTMCADTLQTLFEKGAYAKQHGAGFVVNCIDNDDFDCTCQCGQSYPGFNAILSGYNGGPPPPPCPLFDRS